MPWLALHLSRQGKQEPNFGIELAIEELKASGDRCSRFQRNNSCMILLRPGSCALSKGSSEAALRIS